MGYRYAERNLAADLLLGAAAGAAATWLMGQTTTYLYDKEDEQAREWEDEARGGKTAYGVAAEKAAGAVGKDLSEDQRKQLGSQIHWGLGIGAGAVYGALRNQLVDGGWGEGLAFGTGFWLLVDEMMTPALGLTPGPTAFPWQTHARGLAGHLVFGLAAETVFQVADALA